ncbi:MAG: hypothetical protein BroJett013_25530 [Alphaproteobacteria bacterium]|nr:MAG: hypothetical protein BroJett013_25530 [Alphaproteobacteria bacterium]
MDATGDRTIAKVDELLTRLRHVGPDRPLDQLEPLVWTRIAARRRNAAQPASWSWRASIAAAALAIGAAAGGAAAARPSSEFALFSAHAELAPSTLLGFTE